MKKITRWSSIALVAMGLLVVACKKDKADEQSDDSAVQKEQSADESMMQNESDNSLNEVNVAVSGSTFGKTGGIAGATIDDSTFITEKKLIIHYNGASADGRRSRTGEVTVQLIHGNNWGEEGAIIKIDFNNLRITQVSSGKSIVFNGDHIITNVSGGRAFITASVTHAIRGAVSVTFDNAASRSWQIARRRVISSSGGTYEITTTGDTTLTGTSNICVWGINRAGSGFYTQISQPVVWNSSCPAGPSSGVKVHKGIAREISVTFGVDASGNPVSGTCAYGFKINWTNLRNEAKTAVISY